MAEPAAAPAPSAKSASEQPHLEYLGWGPAGNAFVFVFKSNLYYRERWTGKSDRHKTGTSMLNDANLAGCFGQFPN